MELGAHPFSVRQLQYAVAVATYRNFRAAAEHCLVSQPSLSSQLAELETALGARLFDRDRRSVVPTPAGEALLERARVILREVEELRAAAREMVDPLRGTLRIGVIPTVAAYLLPIFDPALRNTFGDLELIWREDKTESLVAAINEGELDAALLALEAELGPLDHELIGHDPFVLATPPDHPLARKHSPIEAKRLNGEHVLLLEDGHCFRDQALSLCATAGTRELGFRATSLATLCQMVAGGAGITLLPRLAVPVEALHRELAIRNFRRPVPGRTIVLVWRRNSALTVSLRKIAAAGRAVYPK